jgi:extracellular factor (EF) 3-hydroxypalmitic acid methyl ester biosynthesis protein
MSGYQNIVHQDIEIKGPKSQLVRQDRIDCDPDRYTITFPGGKIGKVVNFGPFGLAVETSFKPKAHYSDCHFLVDNYQISQISLSITRQTANIAGGFTSAFSIVGDPLDAETAISIKELNVILSEAAGSLIADSQLRERFRLKVLEIKDFFLKLQNDINAFSIDAFANELSYIANFEDRITLRVSDYFSKMLSPVYDQIKETLEGLPPEELNKYFDYFRKNVGEIMYQSAYAHRAYNKPKGYAGDYEMMNHVYNRELRGNTLFAKCLQRYFVDEPAGRAVRSRESYLRDKIKQCLIDFRGENKIRIFSVASGPAIEIQNLFSEKDFDSKKVEIHLLDQDLDALKHSQRKITQLAMVHGKEANLHLHNLAMRNVIMDGLPLKEIHLIYSAGLFDYFTDPVAIYAAGRLSQALVPGGSLVIGNFSMNNPNQFAMGLIMDWNLIYRSEQKMKDLYGKIGSSYRLEKEADGINLFANITK